MFEYSSFILVNRNTLGPYIFVGCHRMSENSAVGLHKFHVHVYCITGPYPGLLKEGFYRLKIWTLISTKQTTTTQLNSTHWTSLQFLAKCSSYRDLCN